MAACIHVYAVLLTIKQRLTPQLDPGLLVQYSSNCMLSQVEVKLECIIQENRCYSETWVKEGNHALFNDPNKYAYK
jgi:hypothetical protein